MTSFKHIVIVGCGRLGGVLANQLSGMGHSLVIIDRRKSAFDKLSADFSGYKIIGDAVEMQVLHEARIEDADYLFAATTTDNANLMVAQVAREVFGVPNVVARVYDPAREAIYARFGIQTISPTRLSADAYLKYIHEK